jgi:hypothetical protein
MQRRYMLPLNTSRAAGRDSAYPEKPFQPEGNSVAAEPEILSPFLRK